MKEILLKFIKSNKWYLIIQVTFVLINIYFGTYPAKIVGSIVDLLYDINANQEKIISTTIYLLIISFALLIIRLPWRFLVGYLTRKLEIHIKDSVFRQFLKLKISEIQNIKNGEIMSYFAKDAQEIKSAFNRIISYGTRIIATFFIVTFSMAQGVDLVLTIVTLLPMTITIYLIIKIKKLCQFTKTLYQTIRICTRKHKLNKNDKSIYIRRNEAKRIHKKKQTPKTK